MNRGVRRGKFRILRDRIRNFLQVKGKGGKIVKIVRSLTVGEQSCFLRETRELKKGNCFSAVLSIVDEEHMGHRSRF